MGLTISRLIVNSQTTGSSQGQATQQQPTQSAELRNSGQLAPPCAQAHQTPRTQSDPLPAGAKPDSDYDYVVSASTVRPSRTPGDINDLQQYMQWRRRNNRRSVSPRTQGLLERATKVLETVREQIPMRGNVRTDIAQTGGEASRRKLATRIFLSDHLKELLVADTAFSDTSSTGLRNCAITAAATRITGAGNCSEFTAATLIEAGVQLEDNEEVLPVEGTSNDHIFVHLESKRDGGANRVVVLDAWANGPAVLQEDHTYQQQHEVRFCSSKFFPSKISNTEVAKEAKRLADVLVVVHNQDPDSLAKLKEQLEHIHFANYPLEKEDLLDEQYVVNPKGPGNGSQG